MTEGVISVLRWAIRIAFVTAAVFAFIVILNFAVSFTYVSLNGNIISDIFAMMQMWLPFNLNTILLWLTTAVTAYFTYKMTIAAIIWLERLIGNS